MGKNRYITPRVEHFDSNGDPLSGGKLYFYESGTSTPLNTYSDEARTVANTNPVVADSAGRFGDIYLLSQDYKVILKDSDDATIWTADPVAASEDVTLNSFTTRPFSHWGTTTNTAAEYRLSPVPKLVANVDTNIFSMEMHLDSTGAGTLAIEDLNNPGSYLTAQSLKKYDGAGAKLDIEAGDLQAGQTYIVRDDDTDFVVLNPEIVDNLKCNDLTITNTLTLDGTIINGLPSRNYLDGFILSNGTDTDHDIDVTTGIASDSTNSYILTGASAYTKQIDANWAEGTNVGGFPSGLSLSADTWYNFFMIAKTDGTVDFGYDSSSTATNLLSDATGYTLYRRVGSVLTDGSNNIKQFYQIGDDFYWTSIIIEYDATSGIPTSATDVTLTTPLGVRTKPFLRTRLDSGGVENMTIVDKNSGVSFISSGTAANNTISINIYSNIYTDTNSAIQHYNSSSSVDILYRIHLIGYKDLRGKE